MVVLVVTHPIPNHDQSLVAGSTFFHLGSRAFPVTTVGFGVELDRLRKKIFLNKTTVEYDLLATSERSLQYIHLVVAYHRHQIY